MEKLIAAAEKYRQLMFDAERYIWEHPETGYREWNTHKYLAEKYRALGYTLTEAGDIPGFYTDIDTGREGPKVIVFGEMDCLIIPDHPECDKQTGNVHACGHHAQSAALLGIAAALKEDGVLDSLCGSIRLCAVPAEESTERAFRRELKEKGIIRHITGKAEMMRRGWLDDVDMAFMVHTMTSSRIKVYCRKSSNGCMTKAVTYKGVSSHAGGSPWAGVNALYAANIGMTAINALRETFRDSEQVRVHPIVTSGGTVVNAIPETVVLDAGIRAASTDAMARENKKINRAIAASAAAMGASVTVADDMAYAPLIMDDGMYDAFHCAARRLFSDDLMDFNRDHGSASTDMGAVSCVMPALHPNVGGASGSPHGSDYVITDPETACVTSAKLQLLMLLELLGNNAQKAKKIIAEYKAPFASINEYLMFAESLSETVDPIKYNSDGTITIKI